MYALPFIFLPAEYTMTDDTLKRYLKGFLTESIKQMLSRICRGLGNHFKILFLNRFFSEDFTENTKRAQICDELISYMLADAHFREKFKFFKIYKIDGVNSFTLRWVKHLLAQDKSMLFNHYLGNPELIDTDLAAYIRSLDPSPNKNNLITSLPKKLNSLKLALKGNQVTNESDFVLAFNDLSHFIINTHIGKDTLYVSLFCIKTQVHNLFKLHSNTTLEELFDFLNNNLNEKTILFEFSHNSNDIAILDYLLKQFPNQEAFGVLPHCRLIKTKDKPGYANVASKIFYHVNLRHMCSKTTKQDRFDLNNVAIYINYAILPNEASEDTITYHNCLIMLRIYSDFFSDDQLKIFDTYLNYLLKKYKIKPSFNAKIEAFCEKPEKK